MPDRVPLAVQFRGQWRGILLASGMPSRFLRNTHGPCPVCEGKDRFRFDDKEGRGTFFCNHCGAGDGPKLLMLFLGLPFAEVAARLRAAPPKQNLAKVADRPIVCTPRKRAAGNHHMALSLWNSAGELKPGDPAYLYLLRRLGRAVSSPALRQLRACVHPGPPALESAALLACFSDPAGSPAAVQRIFIGRDGSKSPLEPRRMSLGQLPPGGAVRLQDAAPVMGIAEGVETALAAAILFGIPCWATLGCARLEAWEPPVRAREVRIFADNDASGAGLHAAHRLKERLEARVKTKIFLPSKPDTDWNDVLLARLGRQ